MAKTHNKVNEKRMIVFLPVISQIAPIKGTRKPTASIERPKVRPTTYSGAPKMTLIRNGKKTVTYIAEKAVFAKSYNIHAQTRSDIAGKPKTSYIRFAFKYRENTTTIWQA